MPPLLYRCPWDAPRDHEAEFAVYSHAVAEAMPAGLVRQANYVDDWLIVQFLAPAEVHERGRVCAVPAGGFVCWSPGRERIYGHPSERWCHSWLQCSGRRVRPLLQGVGMEPGRIWVVSGPAAMDRGIRAVHEEVTRAPRPDPRILGNLLENLLLEARREAGGDAPADAVRARLEELKRRLDTEHDRPLALAEMARSAGLSVSHLGNLFRGRYGVSPVTYHIARRMDTACYRLAGRTLSVSEVGAAVGYPEPADFSRVFRRVVGTSPRAYRERLRGGRAAGRSPSAGRQVQRKSAG